MKITIDTKEDSHEEIRNAIRLLSHLIGENAVTNQPNIFESPSPALKPAAQENVFGNIFDDSGVSAKSPEEAKAEEKPEDKEEAPSISEYY
jgi:hypothetical protein